MGDWTITVHGTGAHHNPDYPADADRMAEEFTCRLRAAGHTVHSASFTHGARQKLGTTYAPPGLAVGNAPLAGSGSLSSIDELERAINEGRPCNIATDGTVTIGEQPS